MTIKVYNRSTGIVVYELPELNVRRTFGIGEVKDIDEKELEMLSQQQGGLRILYHLLLVDDREWVSRHFEAPIEYWWMPDKIKKSMIEDDAELFAETFDYAPNGVLEYIKKFAYEMPLTDLNKVQIIKDKTGFDVLTAISLMRDTKEVPEAPKLQRRRREE